MTRPRSIRMAAVALLAFAMLAACGGGGDSRPTLGKRSSSTLPVSTTLAPGVSQIAQVTVPEVKVFPSPNAPTPSSTFPNPWPLDQDPAHVVPQVFLVRERSGSWVKVLLPVRPNGTTGWVKASDVRIVQDPYRIQVELGAHRITVYDKDAVMLQEPVAIGAQATPTPPGTYYLRVLLQAPDPNTVYGPYAYGLSGHSDVLTEFNGGDGELGIHGNNDASVLGKSVTHGCVRMSNNGITRLSSTLPLGTQVQIVP